MFVGTMVAAAKSIDFAASGCAKMGWVFCTRWQRHRATCDMCVRSDGGNDAQRRASQIKSQCISEKGPKLLRVGPPIEGAYGTRSRMR